MILNYKQAQNELVFLFRKFINTIDKIIKSSKISIG